MQLRRPLVFPGLLFAALMTLSVACSEPLTKREQSGLIGGGLDAAASQEPWSAIS